MNGTIDLVRREVELCRDVSEVWKMKHEVAMACCDFEDLLGKAISAFESICRIDEAFRRAVARGNPYEPGVDEQIAELYEMLDQTAREMLVTLSRFERAGFKVDSSEEFRRCCRELEGILANPSDFFSDDSLVKMRDDAIDANRRGEVSDCEI